MSRLVLVSLLGLLFTVLSGCGQGGSSSMPNQKSIDDLALLIQNHPEFAEANLQEIKFAATQNSKPNQTTPDMNFATEASTPDTPTVLDQAVAKEAQNLIDSILDQIDLWAQIKAGFKLIGIVLNQQKEELKQFETLDDKFGGEKFSSVDKGSMPKELSCEEFVENPFVKISKEKYDYVTELNKKFIKEKLSGCPNILTQKFLQCMTNFNTAISLINDHATCDINNLDDLDKIIQEKTNINFKQLDEMSKECLNTDFTGCGFKFEQPKAHN